MVTSACPTNAIDAVGGDDPDQGGTLPDPNDLRRAANERFAANALDEALPIYNLAVDVARKVAPPPPGAPEPDLVVHLCNRAACLYRMEEYEKSRRDAAEASALGGERDSKALFRLAKALIALGEYSAAMDAIGKAALVVEEQIKEEPPSDNVDGDESGGSSLLRQKQEFEKLLALALRKQKQASSVKKEGPSPAEVKSIKAEPRTPSIKEFIRASKMSDDYSPLGEGNFSTVVVGEHKVITSPVCCLQCQVTKCCLTRIPTIAMLGDARNVRHQDHREGGVQEAGQAPASQRVQRGGDGTSDPDAAPLSAPREHRPSLPRHAR